MAATADPDEPLTIDDLARRVQLPVRTIREYHTMRLLPPPERRGRLGLYGGRHIQRLQLIARLQRRGYSLAGIRDLLGAWESGTDLTTLLGVDESQAALDETPLRLTRAELFQRLPALDPAALEPRLARPGSCARTVRITSWCAVPRCSAWSPTGSGSASRSTRPST